MDLPQEPFGWVVFAAAVVVIVLALTIFFFWRNRAIDRGFQKGQAANPGQVRQQNPPDHARS